MGDYLTLAGLAEHRAELYAEDIEVDGLGLVRMRPLTLGDWRVITEIYGDDESTSVRAAVHTLCMCLVEPVIEPTDENFAMLESLPAPVLTKLTEAMNRIAGVSEDESFPDRPGDDD